jgi:uncharacterized membrane protein
MPMRLHELHPTLVHYPLALIPAAWLCDAVGWLTGSRTLMNTGRALMPIAAASAAVAGAAGLAAQESVKAHGHAREMLATHRTLNVGLIAATGVLAVLRSAEEEPRPAHLLAGLVGMIAMSYSAYLGGKMVYEHGVGVRAAHGVDESRSPELRRDTLREAAATATANVRDGVRHGVEEMRTEGLRPVLAGMRSGSTEATL